MSFFNILLEQYSIMESLDSVIKSNPNIPEQTIRGYHSTALPDNNKSDKLLNHVLKLHKTGNITPETAHLLKPHLTALNNANKLNQLHKLNTFEDHLNATKGIEDKSITKKERIDINTPIVFDNEDIIIKQHLNHESAVKAAYLHPNNPVFNNTREKGKAQWCVSSDSDLGKTRFNSYTDNGKYPLYTITNKKTKSTHAIVTDNRPASKVEFRDEKDANPPLVDGISSISGILYKYPGIEKSVVGTYLNDKFPDDISTLKKLPHNADSTHIQRYIESASLAENFAAYLHPNISIKQIRNGLQGPSIVRKMVLKNPKVPSHVIDDYLKTESIGANIAAALYHPNISYNAVQNSIKSTDLYEQMTALQQHQHVTPQNIDNAQDSSRAVVRAVTAMNPNLSNDQLTRAIKDPDELVVSTALQHPKVTPEHIEHIINGNNIEYIHQALTHKNATNDHYNKVATHVDAYVRSSLLEHPNIKKEQLEILSKDNVPSIASQASLKLKNIDK